MGRKDIDLMWDRQTRHNINQNFTELYTWLNNLVLNKGDSNPEVVQARGDFDLLYKRFDNMEALIENNKQSIDIKTEAIDEKISHSNFDTEVIAHRGFDGLYPENTLYSARRSAEQGASLEFDIRFTADGAPVIIHDPSVNRTTDGTGNVVDLTLDMIKSFDAGSYFSSRFEGLRIPTLEEYLSAIQATPYIYPDFKHFRNSDDLEMVVRMLITYGFENRCTLQLSPSNNFQTNVDTIRSITKEMKIGASCGNQGQVDTALPVLINDRNGAIVCDKSLATPENLQITRENGLDFAIATITSQQEFSNFIKQGYNKIMTTEITEVQY